MLTYFNVNPILTLEWPLFMGARMPDVLKSILLFKSYLSVGDKNRLPNIWSLDKVLKAFNYLALNKLKNYYIATH